MANMKMRKYSIGPIEHTGHKNTIRPGFEAHQSFSIAHVYTHKSWRTPLKFPEKAGMTAEANQILITQKTLEILKMRWSNQHACTLVSDV